MPLYEYECDACGHRVEIIQKFSDGPPDTCPKCGKGRLQRQQSSPAIQFKGTGWYVTDYAGKGKSESEKSEKGGGESTPAAGKGDAGGDTGSASDTKNSDTKKSAAPAAAPAAPKTSEPT